MVVEIPDVVGVQRHAFGGRGEGLDPVERQQVVEVHVPEAHLVAVSRRQAGVHASRRKGLQGRHDRTDVGIRLQRVHRTLLEDGVVRVEGHAL